MMKLKVAVLAAVVFAAGNIVSAHAADKSSGLNSEALAKEMAAADQAPAATPAASSAATSAETPTAAQKSGDQGFDPKETVIAPPVEPLDAGDKAAVTEGSAVPDEAIEAEPVQEDKPEAPEVIAASPTVGSIVVKGNKRIETETVISFLDLRKGDHASPRKIDAALASAFASGLFADVTIDMQGSTLVVNVVENPVIAEVAFEGNKRINDDDLKNEVQLSPRAVYSKATLQQDVKRILDLYQKNGRYSTVVNPKIIELDNNRVNLVFEIDEGDKSEISSIAFVGNDAFGADRLRHIIKTKESAWWRFFSSDDNYDQDRLAFDQELLRRFYVSHGYADFRVVSATAELSPEKDSFYLTFTLDEGKKYDFGPMKVESKLAQVEAGDLSSFLVSKEGNTYNADEVDSSIDILTEQLGNRGYAFVNIDPQMVRSDDGKTIGINYVITEGPRVYIEHIVINGNVRTLDEVVRREFRIAEGDPYNASKLKRSKQRIEKLGFFKAVEFKNQQGSAPDKVDVVVNVEEQSTGELTFGAGFSTTDGVLGDVGISERNLLGRGQFLKLNATLASVRQEVDLSFTEPYFMGYDVAAGFDLFKQTRDGDSAYNNRTYDSDTVGAVLRGSYSLTEHTEHGLRYSFKEVDITDISPFASTYIKRQAGKYSTSLVGQTIAWDTRDSNVSPTQGFLVRFIEDLAGIGGDAQYFRNELRSFYYVPVYEKEWVLKFALKGGVVQGIGEDVRINDRFFLDSDDLRGFANEGIGPRDATSLDPLGGNIYGAGTLELTFPLGLPEELGFSGSVFTDVATLYETDDVETAASPIFDSSAPRVSVGVGVGWNSPLGPIRVDLATPVVKEDFDETEVFKFSFGTRF